MPHEQFVEKRPQNAEVTTKLQKKSGVRRKLALSALIFFALVLAAVGVVAGSVVAPGNAILKNFGNTSILNELKHLVPSSSKALNGESQDQINILLMGIGGEGHEGAFLADTIIMLSIRPSTGETALISIPRDLAVPYPTGEIRKINALSAVGEERKGAGQGGAYMSEVFSKVFSVPIHYWARIDFSGFENVIDDVGGVDITVDQTFTDYEYPTARFGITTVTFKAGLQHMDGARALVYVRSRHGTGGEGSDFARAKRQQKVLMAVKDKMLSLGMILQPQKLLSALTDLGNHVQTDLAPWQLLRLAELARGFKEDLSSRTVFDADGSFLESVTGIENAYLLVPVGNHYDDMGFVMKKIFLVSKARSEQPTVSLHAPAAAKATVEQWKRRLGALGFTVVLGPAVDVRDSRPDTIIYDFSGNTKPASKALLLEKLDGTAELSNANILNTNALATGVAPDFLILLGQDNVSARNNASVRPKT